MKTKIKSLVTLLVSALSGFINQNEKRRITVGLSLTVGSLVYTFLLMDTTSEGKPGMFILYLFSSFLFIWGLVILTESMDVVTRFFTRISIELAGLCVFGISLKIICDAMVVSFGDMKGFQPLLLLAAVLVATFYVARVSMFVYVLLKKAYSMALDKLKGAGEQMQSKTELFDKTLKNVVSIAGTLALIYNFITTLIKMFMS